MLRLSLLLLHILFPLIVAGQQLTVVELNCENLFDYRHDEGKNDEDYLPESTRHGHGLIEALAAAYVHRALGGDGFPRAHNFFHAIDMVKVQRTKAADFHIAALRFV